MVSKFSFPCIDICSDATKWQFKMLVVLPPIFVADTKIIYGCNFVAPLLIFMQLKKRSKVTIEYGTK